MRVHLEVKALLKREGKTKYWLVNEMDTTYPVINRMVEDRAVAIQLATIGKLCRALRCTPDDLIRIEEDGRE